MRCYIVERGILTQLKDYNTKENREKSLTNS